MSESRAKGLELLRKMGDPKLLAQAHYGADAAPVFGAGLNDLVIEHVMGMVWSRPGLSPRDRSLLTIGILISLRAENELRFHIPIGLRNGLTRDELAELIYHSSVYAGYPAAISARQVALEVLPRE
jgi:4-carboxymuconolactone decarboxylase